VVGPELANFSIVVANALHWTILRAQLALIIILACSPQDSVEALGPACKPQVKRLRLDPDFIGSFMERNGIKTPFSTPEEKAFFQTLIALENSIIDQARDLKLTDVKSPQTRGQRIKQIILPLLSHPKINADTPQRNRKKWDKLKDDIRIWKEMREEVIKRNLGLIATAVKRIQDISLWEQMMGEQMAKLNDAFQAFEPKFNFKFSTYAMRALFEGIGRSFSRNLAPQFASYESYRLAQKIRSLQQDRLLNGEPELTVKEIAKTFKTTESNARYLLNLSQVRAIELDRQVSSDSDIDQADLIPAAQYQSEISFDVAKAKADKITQLRSSITDTQTRRILELRAKGLIFPAIAARKEITIKRPEHVRDRFQEGTRALKALIGIESGRIKSPRDIELLTTAFGLYGNEKGDLALLAFQRGDLLRDLKKELEDLLTLVDEEDLEKITSLDRSQSRTP